MALRTPPNWLEAADQLHSAQNDRLMTQTLVGSNASIGTSDALLVTATSTPSFVVNVAAGGAWIPGTQFDQGTYHVYNDSSESVQIDSVAPVSRTDMIIACVRDAQFDTIDTGNGCDILWVKGGDVSSYPNAILLAQINIPMNAPSITVADIIDKRPKVYVAPGGVIHCQSTTRPINPMPGTQIFQEDTKTLNIWNGTAWGQIWPSPPAYVPPPQRYTACGTTVGTPNASGYITIDYGVTFTAALSPTICSGSGCVIAVASGQTTTQFRAYLYDANGALIKTGARRVNWTVTGWLA